MHHESPRTPTYIYRERETLGGSQISSVQEITVHQVFILATINMMYIVYKIYMKQNHQYFFHSFKAIRCEIKGLHLAKFVHDF